MPVLISWFRNAGVNIVVSNGVAWPVAVDSDCVRTDTGAAAVRVVHVLAGWLVARPFDGCECVTQISRKQHRRKQQMRVCRRDVMFSTL